MPTTIRRRLGDHVHRSTRRGPDRLRYGAYLFKVPMPPAEAREQDKSIACLYVFTVTPPGPFKFTERTRPTRYLPFETMFNFKALLGTFE